MTSCHVQRFDAKQERDRRCRIQGTILPKTQTYSNPSTLQLRLGIGVHRPNGEMLLINLSRSSA